jgi:hypothetical protein
MKKVFYRFFTILIPGEKEKELYLDNPVGYGRVVEEFHIDRFLPENRENTAKKQ